MLMALSAKNKLCLINGSMPKPSDSSPDEVQRYGSELDHQFNFKGDFG
jgi:hypothetical protein